MSDKINQRKMQLIKEELIGLLDRLEVVCHKTEFESKIKKCKILEVSNVGESFPTIGLMPTEGMIGTSPSDLYGLKTSPK